MEMTKEQLADVAGYTYRHLHNIEKTLPDDQKLFVKGEGKKYDLAVFVQRWVAYNVERAVGDGNDLDEVKAIHERVKTRKTELEVQRLEGELVNVHDVRKLWGDIVSNVTKNLLHLPSTIAPMVMMMDNHEMIASIIDSEIRAVLDQLCQTPVPDYAAGSGGEDEEE